MFVDHDAVRLELRHPHIFVLKLPVGRLDRWPEATMSGKRGGRQRKSQGLLGAG